LGAFTAFLAAGFRAAAFFFAAGFFAAAFFAAGFFAATFLFAAGFFAAAFFFAAGFFTAAFFRAAGFFAATFFRAAGFFFAAVFLAAGFFAAAFFRVAGFRAAFFAAGFFLATFLTAFFAAGLRATFFVADFFAAALFFFAGFFFAAGFFALVAILMDLHQGYITSAASKDAAPLYRRPGKLPVPPTTTLSRLIRPLHNGRWRQPLMQDAFCPACQITVQHFRIQIDSTSPRHDIRKRIDRHPVEDVDISKHAEWHIGHQLAHVNTAFQPVIEPQPQRIVAFRATLRKHMTSRAAAIAVIQQAQSQFNAPPV
jgi:hypothetical protein